MLITFSIESRLHQAEANYDVNVSQTDSQALANCSHRFLPKQAAEWGTLSLPPNVTSLTFYGRLQRHCLAPACPGLLWCHCQSRAGRFTVVEERKLRLVCQKRKGQRVSIQLKVKLQYYFTYSWCLVFVFVSMLLI